MRIIRGLSRIRRGEKASRVEQRAGFDGESNLSTAELPQDCLHLRDPIRKEEERGGKRREKGGKD